MYVPWPWKHGCRHQNYRSIVNSKGDTAITVLSAILDFLVLWLVNGDFTDSSVFLDPENLGVDTKITVLLWIVTEIQLYFTVLSAILDAILDLTTFRRWDFCKLLVCSYSHPILSETVEKRFLSIFGGSNLIYIPDYSVTAWWHYDAHIMLSWQTQTHLLMAVLFGSSWKLACGTLTCNGHFRPYIISIHP